MKQIKYQYILAIAEHGSISRAADSLYVSQPYLSKFLIRLEMELGVKLFDRSDNPLVPTPEGLLYLEYCRNLRDMDAKLYSDLRKLQKPEIERLTISTPPIRGSFWLPLVIPAFSRLHPYTEIEIKEFSSSQIPFKIAEGKIDLGIFAYPAECEELIYEKLIDEKVLLMIPRDHPLAYDQNMEPQQNYRILTEDHFSLLEGQKFISCETPRCVTNRTLHYLEERGLHCYLEERSVHCQVSITTKNNATTHHLFDRGMGLAIIMEATRGYMTFQNNPCFYQLGDPPLAETWYIAYRRDARLTPASITFLDLVRQYVPGLLTVPAPG